MKRRRSLLFLLVVSFLALFMALNYFQVRRTLTEVWASEYAIREGKLATYFDFARKHGENGAWDQVHERLNDALRANEVDFFILQYDGEPLWFGERNGDLASINFAFTKTDLFISSPKLSYQTLAYADGARLTIGQYKDLDAFVERSMKSFNLVYYEEGLYVLAILLIAGLWSLRDIRALARAVREGHLSKAGQSRGLSSESAALLSGMAGYQQSVEHLQSVNAQMDRQILPSLKKEIFSGKKPPYDFDCTLVRTDINSFSTIYNSHDVTLFMATINEFFIEVSHIVARYGGLVHEFVGDEVLMYFKDEDHENSFMTALAATRDIGEAAARIHKQTLSERGYPFTVKSSLAHGSVRFGPLVNGFTVAGPSLIETVRILSQVQEKEGNVVFFDSSHVRHLSKHVAHLEERRVQLKGFAGVRTLHSYRGHAPLAQLLASFDEKVVKELGYYRTDEHLRQTLSWLRENESTISERLMLEALAQVRRAKVTKSDFDAAGILCDWVEALTSVHRTPDAHTLRIAASVVMLIVSLVPPEKFTSEIANRLQALLQVGDRRLAANVIEVLSNFNHADHRETMDQIAFGSDARLAANALILTGRDDVSAPVSRRLKKMLNSQESDRIASALFAIGEIAQHHRRRDAVYFATHAALRELVDLLPRYVANADMAVRRQAMLAAGKTGDEGIIEKAWQTAEASPRFLGEAKLHLPPRPQGAASA